MNVVPEKQAAAGDIELSALPAPDGPAFPADAPYLEIVYGPLVGPTAVLLLRNLARRVTSGRPPIRVDLPELAAELGIATGVREVVGRRSRLRHAIERLARAQLVVWIAESHLGVQTLVPPVSANALSQVPRSVRTAHEALTAEFRRSLD
jgi:hypothetical protein